MPNDYYNQRRRAVDRARFTGRLEPSPTGSYFFTSRYSGLSRADQRRVQRNLDNVYASDLAFNRAANPNYQPEQDTGYSTAAAFGSGRATPATTQRYAERYGRDVGGGLRTFTTPSGGSITYRPSGQQLSGGVPAGGTAPYGSTGAFNRPDVQTAYDLGYSGTPASTFGSTPFERSYAMGYNVGGASQPAPTLGYQVGSALRTGLTAGARYIASLWRGGASGAAQYGAGFPSGYELSHPNEAPGFTRERSYIGMMPFSERPIEGQSWWGDNVELRRRQARSAEYFANQ